MRTLLLLALLLTLPAGGETVRFGTYNSALSRGELNQLARDLRGGEDEQARAVAEVIQRVRPDVLLLQEFDFDATRGSLRTFRERYLQVPQNGAEPIDYPYTCVPRVNTGMASGSDLDGDGEVGGPGDAYGWGDFEGQYGMVLLSRFPLDMEASRTFRTLRWIDLPGHHMPEGHYPDNARGAVRLSSKTHAELPIRIGGRTVHALISHPTPPVFDGPEDRNGRRNHDEVRLWSLYLSGTPLRDDRGRIAPLADDAAVVVLGDLNADPFDGDSFGDAINRLLGHKRLRAAPTPLSGGAVAATDRDGRANRRHRGDPAADTADFNDRAPGNLRVDYVLPGGPGITAVGAGVFWPEPGEPGAEAAAASDHRLVWVDVDIKN